MEKYRADPTVFVGRTLGNVTLLSVLGEGSVATVFLGFQRTLRRQVAVKILLKSHETGVASRELFHSEAELVASLHHPNIVPIYDMGEESDCFYQVIHFVNGEDLQSILGRRARNPSPALRLLPLRRVLDIMIQILEALSYAHEQGVIHRDIKPSNVLVDNRFKRPMLSDFGIATTQWTQPSQSGKLEGTPLYMAPEYVLTAQASPSVDIYACGIMLFLLLAGELPLAESDLMKLMLLKMESPSDIFTMRPSQVSQRVDTSLERMILTAIAPELEHRYRSCTAFGDDLGEYLRRNCADLTSETDE